MRRDRPGDSVRGMSFDEWCSGVLDGIGAGSSPANDALLGTWARFESGADFMRWNNPLNTTQKAQGSIDSGAMPGAHDVQKYPDVATGIKATVATLTNGRYSQIVQGLKDGASPSWYEANAAGEYATWGTGSSFLKSCPDHSSSTPPSQPAAPPTPATPEPPSTPAPPAHSGPTFPGTDIAVHSTGTDVSTWQEQLNSLGASLAVDGIFGPLTEEATRSFQSSKGLSGDGIVGSHTWDAAWS